jgi:hypothetical protein
MVEFISHKKDLTKVSKKRFYFFTITYLINVNLYILLFISFDNILIKGFIFFLFQDILYQMLVKTLKLKELNVSALLFGVVVLIAFPIKSFILFYSLFTIILNFIYFKYVFNTQIL